MLDNNTPKEGHPQSPSSQFYSVFGSPDYPLRGTSPIEPPAKRKKGNQEEEQQTHQGQEHGTEDQRKPHKSQDQQDVRTKTQRGFTLPSLRGKSGLPPLGEGRAQPLTEGGDIGEHNPILPPIRALLSPSSTARGLDGSQATTIKGIEIGSTARPTKATTPESQKKTNSGPRDNHNYVNKITGKMEYVSPLIAKLNCDFFRYLYDLHGESIDEKTGTKRIRLQPLFLVDPEGIFVPPPHPFGKDPEKYPIKPQVMTSAPQISL